MNYRTSLLYNATQVTEGLGGNSWDSKHIISTYGADKPHDIDAGMELAQIFSASDRYNGKSLIGMTEAKGKKIYLSANTYKWKLANHRKIRFSIVEKVETALRPGQNNTTFKIVLDKDWVREPDVLIGENNKYPLEIVGEPIQRQLGYEYTVRLQDDNPDAYFPTQLLEVGKEFWKVSTSVVDEANDRFGTLQFSSVFELRGQTGNVAEKIEFTDKALRVDINRRNGKETEYWRIPFTDENGKKYEKFMTLAESEMMNQIMEDIEWGMVYGRKSTRKGPNGYLKRTPAGLRQQLEDANYLTHNGNLTLSKLDDWLSSIYYGRKDATPESRSVVIRTGEMGAKMFDQMVKSEASTFTTVDSTYIRSGKDFRNLSFGAVFTHYVGVNGLDVTIVLDPAFDNFDYSHPHPLYPDKTIDSWRMEVLDFGKSGGKSSKMGEDNISMLCESNADYYYTTFGKHNPKTGMPINDGSNGMAGGKSGYSTMIEKSYGLLIRDISRCGVIELNLDY